MQQIGTPCYTLFPSAPLGEMPTTKRRVAINLPDGEYKEMAALAEEHNVSLAWLGRQAILEFMARYRQDSLQLPLPLRTSRSSEREREAHAAQ